MEKVIETVEEKLRKEFDKSLTKALQKGLKEGLSKMSPLEIKEAFSPIGGRHNPQDV